jgi:Flp pilus assembly protein TadG
MLTGTFWPLCGRLETFRAAKDGNVAVIFAIALIPVTILIGAAVDYAHAGSIKAAMQAALDATALAMAQNAATLTSSELQQQSTANFNSLFPGTNVSGLQITTSYNATNSTQTVSASASVATTFMQMAGFRQVAISGTSTTAWGIPKLQVALVLDNTGSMNQYGKISALKSASHRLLTQLQNAAQNPGDIEVAIIPFTTDVNIGTSYASQWWIDWSLWSGPDSSSTAPGDTTVSNSCSGYSSWSGWPCSSGGGSSYGGWGANNNSSSSTTTTTSTSAYQSQWNGCVTDRVQNYDVQNATPVQGNTNTYFSADPSPPMNGCPAQMMPLGYNWSTMSSLIDSMVANGETNLTIGLAWGWQALSGGIPLNAPAPPPGAKQILIFMTDGLNTADRWYNTFLGTGTQAQIDARTQLVCNNLKTTGITVYTIQVDTGNESPASALLQNCASDTTKWFLLTNPSDLITTFSQIATNLTQLYISH